MSRPFEPISTAEITWCDNQPYSKVFGDVYYSKDSGLNEAHHVYIQGNQLIQRWQAVDEKSFPIFTIAETGFGGGLNFLLTWSLWRKFAPASSRLHFISCEPLPFSREDLLRCLTLWPELQDLGDNLLASYPLLTRGFHLLQFDAGRVNLTLMLGDVLDCYHELLVSGDKILEKDVREYYIDAWFLNGFSPVKNPRMWCEPLFTVMAMLSKKDTTLAASTAENIVQQGLQVAGFSIHQKPWHGGVGDMIVGTYKQLPSGRVIRSTPWHVPPPKKYSEKNVLVLGAGLAGCYTANALARRGWRVTLLDVHQQVGCGASGNHHTVLYPKLSSFYSPLNEFMLHAYLYAVRRYQELLIRWPIGKLSGILQLAYNCKEQLIQENLRQWLNAYPDLGTLVNAESASVLAGINVKTGGLFMPHSGWIDSPALCQRLIQMENINWLGQVDIPSIDYDGRLWFANQHHAEVLVIANGYRANEFAQTKHLPLKSIHGQMTFIDSNDSSINLKIPLCAQGHVIPANDGVHAIGATYNPKLVDNACRVTDDELNIAKLTALTTIFAWSDNVVGHWAGIRAAAPDYLPLVGPVADAEVFKRDFAGFASNSKRWIPSAGAYHEGLFICTGFGSRGLTTIPLSGEWLAATINKEPSCLSRKMVQSISPARFLRRNLFRT